MLRAGVGSLAGDQKEGGKAVQMPPKPPARPKRRTARQRWTAGQRRATVAEGGQAWEVRCVTETT